MAGLILDSSGTIKMKVLDDALLQCQKLHGLIETLAMNAKKGATSTTQVATIKRQLTTLAANLKSHFGMISDLVTNVYISSSRGSSDAARARVLREGLGSIKQAIDIGIAQTKEKHAVHREKPGAQKPESES